MATGQMSEVIEHLRRAVLLAEGAALTDGQLLECFISSRDSAALAALVRRHGPMVWGVCRRIVHDYHDAEDAFQATFLVLVRKAASIVPREKVGPWLSGVAHQTALKARATAGRRKERERQVLELPEPAAADQDPGHDWQFLLDRELTHLPDRYRVVIVLCDLEGKTRKEAAQQLGVPEGTVAGRLARARILLAKRLMKRGVVLPGGLLAGLLARQASACVPAPVLASTIQAATLLAAGQVATAGFLSARVAALTEGVLRTMLLTKLKMTLAVLLVLVAGVGTGGLIYLARAAEPAKQSSSAPPEKARAEQPKGDDLLEQARQRLVIEEQQKNQQIQDSAVQAARQSIEKILKDVEQKTGNQQATRETLERIEQAVRELKGAKEPAAKDRKPVWKLTFLPESVWTLGFRFENPRRIVVDVPGEGRKGVWYQLYEVVNDTDQSHTFLPDFELMTGDKVYRDVVLPGVQETIRRSKDPARTRDIRNSVTIASEPIPPARWAADKKRVGVAFWREVDPDARNFTLFVSGLSNAWSSDDHSVRRKVLKLNFQRTGNELVPTGAGEWIYRSWKLEKETRTEDPRIEVERLIQQLQDSIGAQEVARSNWKEERQRLRNRIRELGHRAEHPPADLKEEDRVALVRDTIQTIEKLERAIASGDRDETTRHVAVEAHKARLKELRGLLPRTTAKRPQGEQAEGEKLKVEIGKVKSSIAGVEQQRKTWQKEREQLQAMITGWNPIVEQAAPDKRKDKETLLKDLQRQLEAGEKEEQQRQIDLELLAKRLKGLEQSGREKSGSGD